ncbi:MAG: ABC-2 family transporter protein [Candidatus Levybacteria bacterium]|nr:ABC-2 family transporter protein [Candidatus Levybacteria bacterium]MBP9815200.1 ABC-2 family transporter protein [Candidatus Levybacteria bacterium]
MTRYFRIWLHSTLDEAQTSFASRLGVILFTLAKFLRFGFFIIFILLIFTKTQSLAGYSLWEIIFFYATFNLVDVLPQMFLRSTYRFRNAVVSGNFDFFMVQPISPLFRALFGGSDILDIPMLFLSIGFIFYSGMHIPILSVWTAIIYFLLLCNALLIATAFHIFVLSIGVATTEVDNTIMLYRDLTQMGRVPITIYSEGVSFLITFVIPIGIMMTFPVQALLGALSLQFTLLAFTIGITFFSLSLLAWRKGIRHYSSASS